MLHYINDIISCLNVSYFIVRYFYFLKNVQNDSMESMERSDILNRAVIGTYSWWPISHFISHFVATLAGFYIFILLFISTTWEMMENVIFQISSTMADKDIRKHHTLMNTGEYQYKTWWAISILYGI